MKKIYSTPAVAVEFFETADIITVSGGSVSSGSTSSGSTSSGFSFTSASDNDIGNVSVPRVNINEKFS